MLRFPGAAAAGENAHREKIIMAKQDRKIPNSAKAAKRRLHTGQYVHGYLNSGTFVPFDGGDYHYTSPAILDDSSSSGSSSGSSEGSRYDFGSSYSGGSSSYDSGSSYSGGYSGSSDSGSSSSSYDSGSSSSSDSGSY
jgi:hypothetical protein